MVLEFGEKMLLTKNEKKIRFSIFCNQILNISKLSSETGTVVDVTNLHQDIFERNRQPEKRSNYLTLVLNDRPFGNVLAVSFFWRCALLRLLQYRKETR